MGTYNDSNPNGLDMSGWKTVFFDGFNGTQLDWTKWPITYGGSMYWNNAFWWDGGQNTVGNGELTIGMDKQSNGIWTVGGLTTMPYTGAPEGHGNTFTYGRVEIRAKVSADVEGAGPCFLLWPSDNSWPPEIDILETPKGAQGMFTNHWRGPNGEDWYKPEYYSVDTTQWHTYALDWLPNKLTLYVDGKVVAETTENIPNIPMSVGLQGHVGQEWDGWYGNPNDTNVSSVDISVDWVRVSQYDGSATPTPPPTPTPINGTAGADNLKGSTASDTITGGAGADTLSGNGGDDSLAGGDGHDTLYGNDGNDVLNGGVGNDALRGGAGDDLITTGTGVDRVLFGKGDGHDTVTDFALGTDRVQLTNVTAGEITATVKTVGGASGLELSLATGESLFLKGIAAVTAKQLGMSGSFAGSTTPTPVTPTPTTPGYTTVNGTAGNDWLKGTAGNDSLLGGAGADDLQGLGGNDILRGGTGDDGLTGGAGSDIFVFARGDGHDWIEDFVLGADKVRFEGISASDVTQTVETRWNYTGVALHIGTDEVFVAGPTHMLGSSDMVFA